MEPSESTIDPNLRDAIQRARGGHQASGELRASIEEILATGERPSAASMKLQQPASMHWAARWAIRGAIAACLVVGSVTIERIRHQQAEAREYGEANEGVLTAMVAAHDQPMPADAQAIADLSNPAAVQAELNKRLTRNVPKPDLSREGWTLTHAAVSPFKGAIAGRYDFTHESQRITMISLPSFAFAGAEPGTTYDMIIDGHPITGFITKDGVHCIVGDANFPLAKLAELRKRLQSSQVASRIFF